jgi:outer membrane protein OmpA-like peptidoglycan-associated protein
MKRSIFFISAFSLALAAHAQLGTVKGVFNDAKDIRNEIPKKKDKPKDEPKEEQKQDGNTSSQQTNAPQKDEKPSLKVYNNYDFVAGSKILFEDDFTSDMDGEFPAHWKLKSGQAVVNKIEGKPAFFITDGNYCIVVPRLKTASYLGSEFTVEYDVYAEGGEFGLIVFLEGGESNNAEVAVSESEATCTFPEGSLNHELPAGLKDNFKGKWHHIAIAYKNKQVKVYCDQYRVLVVPDCNCTPSSVELGGIGSEEHPMKFTSVRIADGAGMNMLGKINTDGRFVTHGILFDTGKSTLRPESMGVLNEIVKVMKENAGLKFEIDGHTDSDGDDAGNLKLSQERADAVKTQLVSMGIDGSRFTTKGFGETKPIDKNDSPEGKANNRRVEFVKI